MKDCEIDPIMCVNSDFQCAYKWGKDKSFYTYDRVKAMRPSIYLLLHIMP